MNTLSNKRFPTVQSTHNVARNPLAAIWKDLSQEFKSSRDHGCMRKQDSFPTPNVKSTAGKDFSFRAYLRVTNRPVSHSNGWTGSRIRKLSIGSWLAFTVSLSYGSTGAVAKHERSIRVARGDRLRPTFLN